VSKIISHDTKQIFAILDNKARFVGGCVRNFLLGIDITDIDIATEHMPEITMQKLKESGIKAIPTGIKHGTITAVLNNTQYEITTLRKDVSCDGRHAEVEFTDSWKEDAARRDFTINAMSMDIDGKVYDYFGGREDLKSGLLKFVGNAEQRANEDILRILRFFRFYAYYGKGQMDSHALDACEKLAEKITSLSGERIQTEMFKLLRAKNPYPVLKVMQDKNISKYLFADGINLNTLKKLQNISNSSLLRLCSLMVDFSKDDVINQAKNWKLSNKDKKYLISVLYPSAEFDADKDIKFQRKTIRALGNKIYKDVVLIRFCCDNFSINKMNNLLEIVDKWQAPVFPLGGRDIQHLGLQGKQIGDALLKAEKWWESEDYQPEKAEILDYITKIRH
jgi:poly(A) polymerase